MGTSTSASFSIICSQDPSPLLDVASNVAVPARKFGSEIPRISLPALAGCLQGRGPAKSIQLVKMSYENKVTRQALKKVRCRSIWSPEVYCANCQ